MRQHSQRPVFINLLQIRFPIGALLSILHRVTGVVLVLAIPLLVYLLQLLNSGETGFAEGRSLLQSIPGKLAVSLVLWTLIQHTLSGIRHLLMDLDFGYQKNVARNTARIAFALSISLIITSGIVIWA
jgi:succinate dehydrogenase / fumarate reductase cytochrome b subunit